MSIATLVLGVGGTGVLSLRALKKLYFELPPSERVPASFLAFDFDRSALVSSYEDRYADLEEAKEFHYLEPRDIQATLRNLDLAQDGQPVWAKVLQWFPDRERVKIPVNEVEANGAGQLRALGRLGFFLNDEAIEQRVRQKLNDLSGEVDLVRLSDDRRVMLISSVAGGTGAGMMIDLAYLVRRQRGRPRVFAYLLLPEVFQDVDNGGRILQNSYACLKELSYLKDQQIPIQAAYLNIPPLDIPVGGEEPFARLFLCPGDGRSGGDAIRAASVHIAEAVLGQLQRTIQQKTLSVVANTVSSSPEDEQLRRRTHCFSTVRSQSVALKPVAHLHEAVFEVVARAMRDPGFLGTVYSSDLATPLSDLLDRLKEGGQARPQPSPVAPGPPALVVGAEDADDDLEDEDVKALVQSWRGRIERQARANRDRIVLDLEAKLTILEEKLSKGKKEDLAPAEAEIGALKELIFGELSDERYLRILENLRKLTNFEELDQQLRDDIRSLLRTADRASSLTDQPIKRKALFDKLLGLKRLFYYSFPAASSEATQAQVAEWQKRDQSRQAVRSLRWWRRIISSFIPSVGFARQDCVSLRKGLANPVFGDHIEAILRIRAFKELRRELEERQQEIARSLDQELRVWRELPKDVGSTRHFEQLEPKLREAALQMLRSQLFSILHDAQSLAQEKDPVVLEEKLFNLVKARVDTSPQLRGDHYVIEWEEEEAESRLREALVRCRQRVFERRTPNPQRKGFVLIMVPRGIVWPRGNRDALRSFLASTATQALGSRCEVEDYEGSRIWIYYEDLFNPPDHIRNLDDYFRSYQTQQFRELFHIDRRFLALPQFRDIHSTSSTFVVPCGNPKCSFNIAAQLRTDHICRGCRGMIRSRCGNADCTVDNMHQAPLADRFKKSCLSCGGFNHGSWWQCCQHGKLEIEIPIDKERCPECIENHQRDPIRYPESKVSRRPDLVARKFCPNCEDINAKNPKHAIFEIPPDLVQFYCNGVNGHDRSRFDDLLTQHKLPDGFRCPQCHTYLIPVDHRNRLLCCKEKKDPCA